MVSPKKHLGQHFLTDLNIARKVALSIQENATEHIIEVGCGTGVLSEFLWEYYGSRVWCTDVDLESLIYLTKKHPEKANQIIEQDILSYDLEAIANPLTIIGNYPYNISSQIVFKVIDNHHLIETFAGMFQKEVAQRLCANTKTKAYGILSVLLQTFYETEYLFTIGPEAFNPPPKVKSGVILATKKNTKLEVPYRFYKSIIKTAFGLRRKMLRNSLSSFHIQKIESTKYFTMRPEELSFVDFQDLAKQLYPHQ